MNEAAEPIATEPPALELRDIVVRFGPITAISGMNLRVGAGEVVALVGDNGAGKSTLIKVMAGLRVPDEGTVRILGEEAHLASPKDASRRGIATVFQDLALCDDLDVVGNLFLGRELRTRTGAIDEEAMERRADELLASLNVTTLRSLRMKVSRLSGGQRQSIAVARSLIGDPHVVLLDEPTAALGVAQTAEVLALIERLKARGIGVVLISHNMRDVLSVADRIYVLRLGSPNGVFRVEDATPDLLIGAITGSMLHDPETIQENS